MTHVSVTRMLELATTWITGAIGSRQRNLSDQIHQSGDTLARGRGWDITATTGRCGFGGRTYRDPRFAAVAPRADRPVPLAGTSGHQSLRVDRLGRDWPGGGSG